MYTKRKARAGKARAQGKDSNSSGLLFTSAAALAQGASAGRFKGRAKVRDARQPPVAAPLLPLPDAVWFAGNPARKHRLRPPHPDDCECCLLVQYECPCQPGAHGWVVLMRRVGDAPMGVRIPDGAWLPTPDDEAELRSLFDCLLEICPVLTFMHLCLEDIAIRGIGVMPAKGDTA